MTTIGKWTTYAGVRFRSGMEAAWAAELNAHGIAWEYEPVTFKHGSIRYTPDFRLGGQAVFLEVQPAKAQTINLGAVVLSERGILTDPLIVVLGPPEKHRAFIAARQPPAPGESEYDLRGARYPSFGEAYVAACAQVGNEARR